VDSAATARLLAARGLRAVPLHPVDPDGRCGCRLAGCPGRVSLHNAGKHPVMYRAFRAEYPPPLAWWDAHPRDPAGIARIASRIVTVEDDGELAQWARAQRIGLPRTFTLASPAGNLRLAYRLPEPWPAARNHREPGGWAVDVMCRHVAPGPGVRNSEGEYRLVRDVPVAAAPPALCSWLADPGNRPASPMG